LHNLLNRDSEHTDLVSQAPVSARLPDDLPADLRNLVAVSGLLRSLDYEEVLRAAVRSVLEIVRADRGFLFHMTAAGALHVRVGMTASGETLPAAETPDISRTVVRRATEERRCIYLPDASQGDVPEAAGSVARLRIGAVLSLPIVSPRDPDRVIAVVYLDSAEPGRPLDAHRLALLQVLANLAGAALDNARLHADTVRENDRLASTLQGRGLLVGESDPMKTLFESVRRVAGSSASVLICGETGTGKESVARLLHDLSDRRTGPYVVVDCTTLPRELVESELFGHEKGAFTGAGDTRVGLVESAQGGTLLLDEITELPAEAQAKLLRFLQEGELRRVGGREPRRVDVRVVAATNRDVAAEAAAGRFRNDLYFRLRVVTLRIPPLRERGRDVLRLAAAFLDRDARTENRRFRGFSPDATAALQAHDWPGNVRDLEHRIRRAVLFAAGEEITAADLELAPAAVGAPPAAARAGGLRALVERTERDALDAALRASDGNVAAAARALGIGRSTLQDLMKRHEWSRKGVRGEG